MQTAAFEKQFLVESRTREELYLRRREETEQNYACTKEGKVKSLIWHRSYANQRLDQ